MASADPTWYRANESGISEDGDQGSGQHRVMKAIVGQSIGAGDMNAYKRELVGLGEIGPDRDGGLEFVSKQFDDAGPK
jgi:hypothetical protein